MQVNSRPPRGQGVRNQSGELLRRVAERANNKLCGMPDILKKIPVRTVLPSGVKTMGMRVLNLEIKDADGGITISPQVELVLELVDGHSLSEVSLSQANLAEIAKVAQQLRMTVVGNLSPHFPHSEVPRNRESFVVAKI